MTPNPSCLRQQTFILSSRAECLESRGSLAGRFWLRVSREALKSARTIVSEAGGAAYSLTHVAAGEKLFPHPMGLTVRWQECPQDKATGFPQSQVSEKGRQQEIEVRVPPTPNLASDTPSLLWGSTNTETTPGTVVEGLHQVVNTRRQGSLGATLEAGYHRYRLGGSKGKSEVESIFLLTRQVSLTIRSWGDLLQHVQPHLHGY